MATSPLVFDVQAKTAGAVAGFKRLASSILPVTKEADKAGHSIDKLSAKKVAPKADATAIRKVKTEIDRLYTEISKAKALDVNADTRKAQAKIRGLQSTLKTLTRTTIDPQVKTGFLTKLKSGLSDVSSGLGKLGGGIGSVFKSIGVPVLGAIGVAVAGIGTALGATAVKALELADSFQRSRTQMNSFVRNMDVTDKLLANIQKYADKTPFEFPELQSAARRLLGIGTNAKEIPKQLALIGDVAAQSGSSVDDLSLIFSQMVSNGRVSAEDMNQLADRGVNAWGALSEATGKSVSDLRELSSTGKLGADSIQLLWDTLGKGAEGSTDALSKSLSGQISTLKDTMNGLLRDIGNALLPIVNSIMPGIQKNAEGFGDKIRANLPAVIDVAAQIATAFVKLPGVVLRGLAAVTQGVAATAAGIQDSMATMMAALGVSMMKIPGMSDFGVSLFQAAEQLDAAADKTRTAGKDTFNSLTQSAKDADAAVGPLAAEIEKARLSAQQAIKLQMDTQAIDTKITKVKGDIKRFTQNKNNAKLDADKTYWDKKIKAAEAEAKRLQRKKVNLKIDAEAKGLKTKIADANSKLKTLNGKKSTPTVRADITRFEKSRTKATHALAVLNVKKANPKLDAKSDAFKKKVADAERKLNKVNKDKASPDITADDKTGPGVRSAKNNLNSVHDKKVTISITTKRNSTGRGTSQSADDPRSVNPVSVYAPAAPAPVINVAAPQITLHLRDERLADLIDVRVDGRAAKAAHVIGRRRGVLM